MRRCNFFWFCVLTRSSLRAHIAVILSEICQNIYAIKAANTRPTELTRLDSALTKWSLELPEHLRFDPAAPKNPPPPPHILTLHMQYWCTVLLLRRPLYVIVSVPLLTGSSADGYHRSIRHIPDSKS